MTYVVLNPGDVMYHPAGAFLIPIIILIAIFLAIPALVRIVIPTNLPIVDNEKF